MEVDGSHMTEKIWSLTLEIIYLLSRETFPPVKSGDRVTITVTPPPSLTPKRRIVQKILEVTNKITELLTGEGRVMTERRHSIKEKRKKLLSAMYNMESTKSPQHHNEDLKMEPPICQTAPQRSPRPLYSQDSTQEVTLHHYQTDIEEEEEIFKKDFGGDVMIIKVEPSSCPVTPERSQLEDDGGGSAAEEIGVTSNVRCKEDENSPVIGAAGRHTKRKMRTHVDISPDEIIAYPITGDLHPDQYSADPSSDSAIFREDVPDDLLPVYHPRAQNKVVTSYQSNLIGEKPYSCFGCGKRFSRKFHLITHERVHTGEKPYPCSECDKCFADKSHLLRHEKIHRGVKPYCCSACGKCFSYKSNLTTHERVHTGEKPYSCPECEKCFADKSHLNKHIQFHTGQKPYSCSECGKCFSVKSYLNKHAKIHTVEKPYSSYTGPVHTVEKPIHTVEKPYSSSYTGPV